jgi:alkaline phosphatase D
MLLSIFVSIALQEALQSWTFESGASSLEPRVVVGEVSSNSAWIQIDVPTRATLAFGISLLETQVKDREEYDMDSFLLRERVQFRDGSGGVVRFWLSGLKADTEYSWSTYEAEICIVMHGSDGSFRTLPEQSMRKSLNFVVTNCMNYDYFMNGGQGRPPYQGKDKAQGYPGLEAIRALDPRFVVFAGDSVYYDRPSDGPATDAESMRTHWRKLFVQPRMRKLLASTATYWMKDDHDHRFDDSDQTGDKLPSHELGRKIFREQVPIVALDDDASPTWRTVRVSKDLQIWMTEGRDHRSPNTTPDGAEKTLWGTEQRDWLKRTLLASDAAFKILISPTPMVGPDDLRKADNHTNPKGFRTEGEAFHAWLTEHKLNEQGFFVICGDRHWQYHSIHPQGTHEFAVGALIDANARLGRKPGDPQSTDAAAKIQQPYSSKVASGGFLEVRLETEPKLHIELIFRDERGVELHRVQRKP